MSNEFSFKELYDVVLKATYPIEINGKEVQIGEVIAFFDKIQIANFQEIKDLKVARGGFDNRGHVYWDTTKEIQISFAQGIFSKTQFALMNNAKLLINDSQEPLLIHRRKMAETDENGAVTIEENFVEPIFIYDENYNRIQEYQVEGNKILLNKPYCNICIDYNINYTSPNSVFKMGNSLVSGYLELEGKTRIQDDITGHMHTGVLKIPKLKLMSNLSMKLGEKAVPMIGVLDAIAVPVGYRGNSYPMEMFILDEDIDSDM